RGPGDFGQLALPAGDVVCASRPPRAGRLVADAGVPRGGSKGAGPGALVPPGTSPLSGGPAPELAGTGPETRPAPGTGRRQADKALVLNATGRRTSPRATALMTAATSAP